MYIYLIRHSKPDVPDGTFYGQSDVEVTTQEFEQTVNRIRKKIEPAKIDALYTSPLKRCMALARSISQDHSEIRTDNRIKELNFGDWELKHLDDIDPEEMKTWTDDFANAPVPGGESHIDLYYRVSRFWEEILNHANETLTIVTHAGVIKSVLSKILEIPLRKSYSIKVHYGELIAVRYFGDDQYEIEFLTSPE